MLSSPLDLKSFQLSSLTQMLSTALRQPAAAKNEDAPEPQQFPNFVLNVFRSCYLNQLLNWKGKGAAQGLLPEVEEEN